MTAVAMMATPELSEALPSLLAEIGAIGLAAITVSREDGAWRPRMSNPGLAFLAWSVYFLVLPSVSWISGKALSMGDLQPVRFTPNTMIRLNVFHTIFIFFLILAYRIVIWITHTSSTTPVKGTISRRVGLALFAIGIAPIIIEIATRLATTGSLRPEMSYGDFVNQAYDSVQQASRTGGLNYLITQISLKLMYVPVMCLGVALGMYLTRAIRYRRRLPLLLVPLILPALLYFGPGARSNAAITLIVAILVAELLARQIPWTYVLTVAAGGLLIFNFYSTFRVYQSEQLTSAVEETLPASGDDDSVSGEGPTMLIKEAYAFAWTDATHTVRGANYFIEAALSQLPQQIFPEKLQFLNTGNLLGEELWGRRTMEEGGGVAGAMIADGYMIGGVFGVIVLATVLGALLGAVVWLLWRAPNAGGGVPIWRAALLVCFTGMTFLMIRGDLTGLLAILIFYVLVPVLAVKLFNLARGAARRQAV